jgi:hypothetical protein
MSSTGNRGNPNHVRTSGQTDSPPAAQDGDRPDGIGQGTIGGSHQESRDHHKHNHAGQPGHKPQRHNPSEEKH